MPFSRNLRRGMRRLQTIVDRLRRVVHDPYPVWIERRVAERTAGSTDQAVPGQFSFLTCVYQGTPAELFRQTAQSVFDQSECPWEWIVLAQGPVEEEVKRLLVGIASDTRVRVLRTPMNQGVIRGLRQCLEAATGEFVIPLDADDLLCPDALRVLGRSLQDLKSPEFLYSDEDILVGERPRAPYFRPDWDPVLNLASSYIWHLSVFRRTTALRLGVYSDVASNWCQDWDTVCRFADAGITPVHIPEVLHHWRRHRRSSTNRDKPESGSLDSQKHILEQHLARRSDQRLFRVEPFPMFRGAFEWCIERRRIEPEPVRLVCRALAGAGPDQIVEHLSTMLRQAHYPFQSIHILGSPELSEGSRTHLLRCLEDCEIEYGIRRDVPASLHCWPTEDASTWSAIADDGLEEITVVCSTAAVPQRGRWPWEVQKLFALHPDLMLIAGRLVDDCGFVLGGARTISENGGGAPDLTCPDLGRLEEEPGDFALLLKERTVDAVDPEFFAIRTERLQCAVQDGLPVVPQELQGIWLSAYIAERGKRVAATPLVAARVARDHAAPAITRAQWEMLRDRFPNLGHKPVRLRVSGPRRQPRAA